MGVPSAHAWRHGWAVQALRNGVSETSVRAAAGWSSGAMVARLKTLEQENARSRRLLAEKEFDNDMLRMVVAKEKW